MTDQPLPCPAPRRLTACAWLLAGTLGVTMGCAPASDLADGGDGGVSDLGRPAPDLASHPAADVLACESALATAWQTQPPVVGLGSTAAIASYRKVVATLMANFKIPGGAVAVTQAGRLVLALGIGLADREEQQPVQPDSLFRIASLSKQLTSVAILKMVESGRLSLDDKAFSYLSDLKPLPGHTQNPQLAAITIRNLLQHTGGWNRDTTFDPMFYSGTIASALGEPGPPGCADIVRYMLDQPLQYTPGSTTCYSNFGYCVLGQIVQRVAGRPYYDQVAETVLRPVGAGRISLGRTLLSGRADGEVRYYDFPGAGLATSVFPGDTAMVPWPYGGFYLEAMDAHGGYIASTVDMLRYQAGIDGRTTGTRLLSAASRAALLANPNVPSCTGNGGTTPASPDSWYGLGFAVNSSGNSWHTGALSGTATEDVIASNGFSWSAFFNSLPQRSDAFSSQLDTRLWDALGGAGAFPTGDLFDQYGDLSSWLSAATYQTMLERATAAGSYPSHIEGQKGTAGAQYRARFTPLPDGTRFRSEVGLDCIDYRAHDASLAAQGYHPASLQSYRDDAGLRRYQVTWVAN